MYKLMIKTGSNWLKADISDEAPAMTYQANDLAELKDRQADYSQSLKLPITENNRAIFGYADDMTVIGDGATYRRLDCRLYNNESLLAGASSYILLLSVNEYFNCQILSGNANFFDALDGLKLSEVNSEYFIQSIRDVKERESDLYKWAIYTSVKDEYLKSTYFLGFNPKSHLPIINIFEAAKLLANILGYSITHNLTNSQIYEPYLTVCNTLADDVTRSDVSGELVNSQTFNRNDGTFYFDFVQQPSGANGYFAVQVVDYTIESGGVSTTIQIPVLEYTAPKTCDLTHRVSLTSMGNVHVIITKIGTDGTLVENIYSKISDVSDTLTIENNISLEEGEKVRVILQHRRQDDILETLTGVYGIAVNVSNMELAPVSRVSDPPLNSGVRVPIFMNLGLDTALDLFKIFMQIFGFIAYVNPDKKNVALVTYKHFYDNKDNALNWTYKIDHSRNNDYELSFDLKTYARTNIIKFQKFEDYQETANFNIQNDALAKTKDLFEIKTESGVDRPRMFSELDGTEYLLNVAYIPVYSRDTDTNLLSLNSVKTRLVNTPYSARVTIDGDTDILGVSMPVATHIKLSYLLTEYYDSLINRVLDKAKVLEVLTKLEDTDIENFNPLTPIYLAQYSSYFIVNKITNYTPNSLTKVELIKL